MLATWDKVDSLIHNPDGSHRLLLAIEAGEAALPNADWLLQEKLNAYASYALDGQMVKEHPDAVGKPVGVAVYHAEPLPESLSLLIEAFRQIVGGEGLEVSVDQVRRQAA